MLAAGTSSRFGGEKLLYAPPPGRTTLLERAIRACGTFPAVVVCSTSLRASLDAHRVTIVCNDAPELGMTHSLQLANAVVDPLHGIAVLPADLALIEERDVAAIVAASAGIDVTYPRHPDGTPGHPVIFSSRARRKIPALPPGDTIRLLRDRADFTRLVPAIAQRWPYADVDLRSD